MHLASFTVHDSDGESAWLMDRCKQVPGMLFDGVIVRRVISDPVDNLRALYARTANPLYFVKPHRSAPALRRAYKSRRRSASGSQEPENAN